MSCIGPIFERILKNHKIIRSVFMKTIWRIFLGGVVVVVLAMLGGTIYIQSAFPKVGPSPVMKIEGNAEQIEHGRYLANHVTVCMDCHSKRDWTRYSAPPVSGTEGAGGEIFNQELGLPGVIYASNISPTGIGNWTAGDIYRAMTSGVRENGEPLFPIMPYLSYSHLDPRDAEAIIAYLLTLPHKSGTYPDHKLDFPMNLIVRTIPQPADPWTRPDTTDLVSYGRYITMISGCSDCHTPMDHGEALEGMYMAGGQDFELPGVGIVRPANLTPDKMTGLGNWTEEMFVQKFTSMDPDLARDTPVEQGRFNTIMPWTMYAGMHEIDLRAIYAYLQTVPAVPHSVVKFTPEL